MKFYFIGAVAFIFIYCGAGSGWGRAPESYLVKYCVYMVVFGLVCKWTIGRNEGKYYRGIRGERYSNFLDGIIGKYGSLFITIYVCIPLIQLVLAGKVMNIVSPPALSLDDAIEGRFGGDVQQSFIESVLYYVQQLVLPFYVVSLYKIRRNIGKLTLALLLPLYFAYANSGYLARSGSLPFVVIIFVAIYMKYPQYRKKFIILTAAGLPLALFFLSWFTFARKGSDFNISFGDAILLLAQQETSYPIQYDEIQRWPFDWNVFAAYVDWLVKLPFPGFLKSTGYDYSFTAIFSEKMTGGSRTDPHFNILLPGLVGESVFIFGKMFYWIHAIITGWVIGMAYKLVHHRQEFFLVLYMTIYSGLCFARAGTVSTLPFYFKHLIIYLLVVYIMSRPKTPKRVIDNRVAIKEMGAYE